MNYAKDQWMAHAKGRLAWHVGYISVKLSPNTNPNGQGVEVGKSKAERGAECGAGPRPLGRKPAGGGTGGASEEPKGGWA